MAKPARGSVKPVERLDGEPTPLPNGVDYADELIERGMQSLGDDDLISAAIGSPIYVERPGASWVPWAKVVDPPVEFSRYYPKFRLLVDIFPALDTLDQDARAKIKQEAERKVALTEEYGYRYSALHYGQRVDSRMFYTAPVEGKHPPVVDEDGGAKVEAIDPFGALGGFLVDAGPPELSWAVRRSESLEWVTSPLRFSRYYWAKRLAVDFLPSVDTLYQREREALEEEVSLKKRLAAENGVTYLALWGQRPSTDAELSAVLARESEREREGLQAEDVLPKVVPDDDGGSGREGRVPAE